jgi:hypothetical protein
MPGSSATKQSEGWLPGVDLNHRPLGYELIPVARLDQLVGGRC